jgi:hypothetical protein
MRVEYELVPEDWAAFAEHCASRPRGLARFYMRLVGALLILVVVLHFIGTTPQAAALALVLMGAWWWVSPQWLNWGMRQQAINRDRPCLKGRHVLEANSEGLHARCEVSESHHKWVGVRAVESSRTHVFVLIGESLGYTVPRTRILSGDLQRFVDVVNGYAGRDA